MTGTAAACDDHVVRSATTAVVAAAAAAGGSWALVRRQVERMEMETEPSSWAMLVASASRVIRSGG